MPWPTGSGDDDDGSYFYCHYYWCELRRREERLELEKEEACVSTGWLYLFVLFFCSLVPPFYVDSSLLFSPLSESQLQIPSTPFVRR